MQDRNACNAKVLRWITCLNLLETVGDGSLLVAASTTFFANVSYYMAIEHTAIIHCQQSL